jgi:hypothetical protein
VEIGKRSVENDVTSIISWKFGFIVDVDQVLTILFSATPLLSKYFLLVLVSNCLSKHTCFCVCDPLFAEPGSEIYFCF